MENAQEILAYSFVVFLLIAAIAAVGPGSSGFAATLGNAEFKYRFDRTRIPLCTGVIIMVAVFSFAYGLVVARDLVLALQFCLGVSIFGAIGCVIRICLVRGS
jgi:hypothetical protein